MALESYSQTFHFGMGAGLNATSLFNNNLALGRTDTDLVISGGRSLHAYGAIYFDRGGYYAKRLYGVKTGIVYSWHNQRYDIFPPESSNSDSYLRFKSALTYLDLPLMFNTVTTHNQGFYGEAGLVLSMLSSANGFILHNTAPEVNIPQITNSQFEKWRISAILGLGVFFNTNEWLGFNTSIRMGSSLQSVARFDGSNELLGKTYRIWLGLQAGVYYKINKYDAKKRKRFRRQYGKVL